MGDMAATLSHTPAEQLYDLVIIGGGPGGATAALYTATPI